MAKKITKREADTELLESIFALESKWKQLQSIMRQSIDSQEKGHYEEQIARANYMFLLREARYQKISAIRYSKY